MALYDFLFGQPERLQQVSRFTPQQSGALNQILSQALGNLSSARAPLAPLDFGPIAQQARTQFQNSTIPLLADRFSSLGSGGSQRSSAFQGALGSAASNLEQGLASLGSQQQLQQRGLDLQQRGQDYGMLSNLLNVGLQPQFETLLRPQSSGFLGGLGAGASQGIGSLLPLLLSGYLGGGSALSSGLGGLGSLFGGSQQPSNQLGLGSFNYANAFGRSLSF